jgi:Domain of unknown function (DUF4124)
MATIYKYEDEDGKVHYTDDAATAEAESKRVKNRKVERKFPGTNDTEGKIYHVTKESPQDTVDREKREAERIKNEAAVREYDEYLAKNRAQREADKKKADELAKQDRLKPTNWAGGELHIACYFDAGGEKVSKPLIKGGRQETPGAGDITFSPRTKIKKWMPKDWADKTPFDCDFGATLRVSPGDAYESITGNAERGAQISEATKKGEEIKNKFDEVKEEARERAKKDAEDIAKGKKTPAQVNREWADDANKMSTEAREAAQKEYNDAFERRNNPTN